MAGSLQISLPSPVYPSPRMVLEAPRPRYVSRTSSYPLRSSPLAGPAIAISRPSVSDNTEEEDYVDSEKTRRGATPSRISTLHPSPPSSLRSISMSRTPSPSRSTSEFSHKSSASSATSHSITPSPPLSPAIPSGSHPQTHSHIKLHLQPPPPAHVHTSISISTAQCPASAASFRPNTSPDSTRNWLTRTAPPPFSRSHVKAVVMPVKASKRRPQTAPAAPYTPGPTDGGLASTSPLRRQLYRRDSTTSYSSAGRSEHGSMNSVHNSAESSHPGMPSGTGPVIVRKRRRSRSLKALSLRSTLDEVREEQEREGEGEGEGERESRKDRSALDDAQYVDKTLVFPALAIKDEDVEISAAPRGGENFTGWIRRRWSNSLKLVKGQLAKSDKMSTLNGP